MLTREQILEIAALARLKLDDGELDRIRQDLSGVIEHMDSLKAVETEGIAPMIHALPESGDIRKDEISKTITAEMAITQAPAVEGTSFKVPAIITASSLKE